MGCDLRLLDGGKPLSQHTCAPRKLIGGFYHVAGRVDIWDAGSHTVVNLDAAPAGDAAGADEVNQWLDADGNQRQLTWYALSTGRNDGRNLAIFADNLADFFSGAHINAIPAFFLQHHI